ncbi:hypothetical protein I3843_01G118100 [Carya illinoinensis]|nr:hypothetical protein I3843_01G118100 [Carya illinoinensis]KAG7995598.1 hypothetical protein I3843_01G118100 [Carya illinoinensis]
MVPAGRADDHYITIDEKLLGLSTPIDHPEYCIFQVHHSLREVNKKAYEPDVLAIGPYHHGKDGLAFMEKHKLRLLHVMLKRKHDNSVERYFKAMRDNEQRARDCYADQFPQISSDGFVEMMLLDGCFIVELFRLVRDLIFQGFDPNFQSDELHPNHRAYGLDLVFQTVWMLPAIMRDLLLLENQVPFFILNILFEMSEGCNQRYDDATRERTFMDESEGKHSRLLDCAVSFFYLFTCGVPFKLNFNASRYVSTDNIKHLLGLIHEVIGPSLEEGKPFSFATDLQEVGFEFNYARNLNEVVPNENEDWMSIPYATELKRVGVMEFKEAVKFRNIIFDWYKTMDNKSIPTATELRGAGVKFKVAEAGKFFDIKFNKGQMEIPPLVVEDNTETLLRNLIAYEQYSQNIHTRYVTEYLNIMDFLINTPKDVELLRRAGIIENLLGDDEVVSNMFNKLGDNVNLNGLDFCYADIFAKVNKHCAKRRNVWMAKLRRDYFNSPWAWLSVLAAILLLLLAFTQTIFSILSYKQKK